MTRSEARSGLCNPSYVSNVSPLSPWSILKLSLERLDPEGNVVTEFCSLLDLALIYYVLQI